MILSSRSDLFRFEFPKVFIPQEVKTRWAPYVQRMPTPTDDISAMVNYSVQSFTVPNYNYQAIEQVKPGNGTTARGTVRKWRNSLSPEMMSERKFEVTLKLLDGYWNYWVMLETFFHHYDFDTRDPFIVDMPLRIMDAEGNVLYTVTFHDCLFTGIDKFDLSFSEVEPGVKTFTCNFEFNETAVTFDAG
jgi:hypothetical protein